MLIFLQCIHAYLKAYPEVTPIELENAFREAKLNTYLIAKEQTLSALHTIVSLQGEPDQKYVLSFQFSQKPRRLHFAEGWPSTPEENMQRLAEAGIIMDSFARKCTNCNEIGHSSKACEQEKGDGSKIAITCQVCNEEGHRARDCIQERKSNKKGCRNCGSEEHIAKECPEPRSAENVECKNCGQMGHFSRDCPDRAPETCHNCLQEVSRVEDLIASSRCKAINANTPITCRVIAPKTVPMRPSAATAMRSATARATAPSLLTGPASSAPTVSIPPERWL